MGSIAATGGSELIAVACLVARGCSCDARPAGNGRFGQKNLAKSRSLPQFRVDPFSLGKDRMTRQEAQVPVPLAFPLRPFRPADAAFVAAFNDSASNGIAIRVWQEKAGPGGDGWDVGRLRQIERMESGEAMVVVDQGDGPEAVMMGHPIGQEPGGTDGVADVFHPLVDLENCALGSWYLNVLGTAPARRRQGHGKRLMAVAEDIARAGGHTEISIIVADANAPARALYAATGYVERDRRPMVKNGHGAGIPGENWLLLGKPLALTSP